MSVHLNFINQDNKLTW